MCGIFGVIARPHVFIEEKIKNALNQLYHRGPDDWGLEKFNYKNWEIHFGFRRLAILDLSPLGHQPMNRVFENKKKSLVFNGEIYNYKELKKGLKENWDFKSTSDSEVLFAGLNQFGPEFLKQLNGMLAFAFYDEQKGQVIFARDRVGKKPLYIYRTKECLVFSSELKAITFLNLSLSLNTESLNFYRWLGYIPAHLTIYNECRKLNASTYQILDLNKNELDLAEEVTYWDPLNGYGKKYKGSYEDAVEELSSLLDDATRIRLDADVPVGVFLSGGIDSSLVLSSIKKFSEKPLQAFSVKFNDPNFDESEVAESTAKQLGINLKILQLKEQDYFCQVDKIPFYYDEPFSDSSQIPTMAISESAREHVTVILTGDGGDEVFLGYPRFSYVNKIKAVRNILSLLPKSNLLVAFLLSRQFGHYFLRKIMKSLGLNLTNLDVKISKLSDSLTEKNIYSIYDNILSTQNKSIMGKSFLDSKKTYFDLAKNFYPNYAWYNLENRELSENFAALDLVTYLKDDVLVKVDRATMAYSLEARSPLLDYRIIEFGTSLPAHYKIKNGVHKSILRSLLSKRLGGQLALLPKRGFGVPLPQNLPAGPNMTVRWNTFIEQKWMEQFSLLKDSV